MLTANPNTTNEGKLRLEALAAKYPDDPRCEESLGLLAMRNGLQDDAVQHFTKAMAGHSKNPDVWYGLAHLKITEGGDLDEAIALLQRTLAASPSHYNARMELGFAAAKNGQFDVAVAALKGIAKPRPEHAYVVTYTLAYCLNELHQGSLARSFAEQARKFAATNADQRQVAGLLSYLERVSSAGSGSR